LPALHGAAQAAQPIPIAGRYLFGWGKSNAISWLTILFRGEFMKAITKAGLYPANITRKQMIEELQRSEWPDVLDDGMPLWLEAILNSVALGGALALVLVLYVWLAG
jgi:hypothetical protein